MPASEIDDIFAGVVKTVPRSAQTNRPSSSKSTLSASKSKDDEQTSSKKKKAKKRKLEEANDAVQSTIGEGKGGFSSAADEVGESKVKSKKAKRVVETIIDPSLVVEPSTASLPRKLDSKSKSKSKPERSGKNINDGLERFKDSRGIGPSTLAPFAFSSFRNHNNHFPGKQTEEGFMIYKEDELGIKDEGGGESSQLYRS